MADTNVVVLGAGVVGLTTAYLLSQSRKFKVTIVAKHMPGDLDVEYTSPWAGAHYYPVGESGTRLAEYERDSWEDLSALARGVPEAGIHFQDAVHYTPKSYDSVKSDGSSERTKEDPWFGDVLPNFRKLKADELPIGISSGQKFTTLCINTALYLPWLASQTLKRGGVIKRAVVQHVTEAADLHHSGKRADIVINCSGLGSLELGGVEDKTMYPIRGQTVVVRNNPGHIATTTARESTGEVTYVLPRASGGGTVLGGCVQERNWNSQVDPDMANRIMKRCIEVCPALTNGKGIEALSIIRHAVGFRPAREDGPRVEKEMIQGIPVVHNYGHAGYGFQSSFGTAKHAVKLVEELVSVKSKL